MQHATIPSSSWATATEICSACVTGKPADMATSLLVAVGQSSLEASRSIDRTGVAPPSASVRPSVCFFPPPFKGGVAVGKGNLFWATTWKTDRDDRCVTSIDPDHPDSLFPSSSRVRSAKRIAAAEAKNWSFRFLSRLCVTRRRIACVA